MYSFRPDVFWQRVMCGARPVSECQLDTHGIDIARVIRRLLNRSPGHDSPVTQKEESHARGPRG